MISGVWTALPNIEYFGPDDGVLGQVLDHLFGHGVQGILALGTTGQGADKTIEQRMLEVERLCACCSADHILVGVLANPVEDVRRLIRHAAESGVRGVAITAPYYGLYAEPELHAWLAESLQDSPSELEYYMYNIPFGMHHRWTMAALDVAARYVTVSGIKDSSGDVGQLIEYLNYAKNNTCRMMAGDERLGLYHLLMGGHGFVSGLSASHPELMCKLYEACTQGRVTEAAELQEQVNRLMRTLRAYPSRQMVSVIVDWMRENGIVPAS